jgi:hypothetical protein
LLKQIGKSGSDQPDLLRNLLDCHERIRRFTELAVRLGQPAPTQLAGQVGEACAQVKRYFTVALPLHAADEELSIAPRLLPAAPELADELASMSAEHAPIHQVIADLVPLWDTLVATPERHADLSARLRAPALWLSQLFETHLRPEEELIFPTMIQRLTPDAVAEILGEMKGRRIG